MARTPAEEARLRELKAQEKALTLRILKEKEASLVAQIEGKHEPHQEHEEKESVESHEPEKSNFIVEAVKGIPKQLKADVRSVGRLGRNAAVGIAGIADIPNIGALAAHSVGLKKDPMFYKPVSTRLQETIDKYTHGKLKARTKGEEYSDIITEGLAPLALAPVTGGASLTNLAARGIAKKAQSELLKKGAQKVSKFGNTPYAASAGNIAGSVGSSTALKAYMDEYQDPNLLGALLASTAGGTGGRAGRHLLKNPKNAAASVVGHATGFDPAKYAESKKLGIPVTPANVSKYKTPQFLEMIAAKTPGSMGPLEDFYKKREAAIARNMGIKNAHDLEHVVTEPNKHLAKKGAKGYNERVSNIFKTRENKFKAREDKAIADKELIDVSDITDKLKHERASYITPAEMKDFDLTPNGQLLKKLESYVPKSASADSADIISQLKKERYPDHLITQILAKDKVAGGTPKGIGLKALNSLREKALHEHVESKTPFGKSTPKSKDAGKRHHMLSSKRHEFMETVGNPTEKHNAREARLFYSRFKDKDKGTSKQVSKLMDADTDTTAFNKLKKDEKYINVVRQGLTKEEKPLLAEALIADLGRRQGRFNINTAHTKWSDSPVKKEILKSLSSKEEKKKFLSTMELISKDKKAMEKLANTSGTAHSTAMIDLAKRYGTGIAGAVVGAGTGTLVPLVGTSAALYGGSKAWTNQDFLKRINKVMTEKKPNVPHKKTKFVTKNINRVGRQMRPLRIEITKGTPEEEYEKNR